ncbi:MAG TPA: tetratricopeptide repeat protein [Blastocatellia bacterium]|nr:tetratricopeptide repeat protein [Blastocatellia bacterium]
MSDKRSFIPSVVRALSLLVLLAFVLVSSGYSQDPSGRPKDTNPKGKKPPKKTPSKGEPPQALTVTLTVLTDPVGSDVLLDGKSRGVSNDEGKVQIDKLPLAHYNVEVRKEGYKPLLRGFQAGLDSPTLVFKLDVDLDPSLKEFDGLVAAGKLAGAETPNALELLGKLTKQYGERPEFIRLRVVLAGKLVESATPTVNKTISDSRGVGRDEVVRALDALINALALKSDDNHAQAQAAYLRGLLAVRDGQGGSAEGGDGQPKNGGANARAEFESALKFDETFIAARYQLGLLLLASSDLAGAETHLLRVTQAEPRWAFALTALGSVYYGGGKFKEAIEAYRRAIAIDPKYAAAYAGLGLARFAKGEKDGVKDIERAAQLDPASALPHLNLGIVYSQSKSKKDWPRAEEEFKKAIQMNAQNLEFQNSAAERMLGDVQKRKK